MAVIMLVTNEVLNDIILTNLFISLLDNFSHKKCPPTNFPVY